MSDDTRQLILATIVDLVQVFLHEGRKDDDELPRGAIETAVADGTITVDEIVAEFGRHLRKEFE